MIMLKQVISQRHISDDRFEVVLTCGHSRVVRGIPQRTRCRLCETKNRPPQMQEPARSEGNRQNTGRIRDTIRSWP